MKRYPILMALAVLVGVVVALGGCGEDAAQTTEGDMQDTTTMSQATTTYDAGYNNCDLSAADRLVDNYLRSPGHGWKRFAMAQPGSYTDLTPEQAKQLIETTPDLVIIDVSPHYDEGHLPGAVSYYLGDGSLEKAIPTLDKDTPYLVYCHVDSVAISGAQALVDAGFTMVYRLDGNYSGWVDAGLPVER